MRLSEQLVELRALWRDPAFGPLTSRYGPQVVVGGMSDMTFARVARHADGYVHGGGPPRTFATAAEKMRRAWLDHGRLGEPRLWAQAYFALGDTAVRDRGRDYLLDYYAFTGPFAATIARALLATPQSIAAFLRGYAQAGCEELVLLPAVPDPDQVDRLAAVIEEDADLLVPV
jgi:alkanesulfonate monooxygenase SsuD/methylene tetrahydromethanopterin reductase-like flavin-dependent oxidoreductase (luciferase family)